MDKRLEAARAYLERGWKLFTVNDQKRPWHNCGNCTPGAHEGDACACLWCHGHLAASGIYEDVKEMVEGRPGGHLAVACGTVSGLVVVDAEGTDRVGYGRTGLEVLEDWEWWGDTLRAVTSGGGLHLFYRYPEGGQKITSRTRVAPNIDIKADGGYVVLPPAAGRRWMNWTSLQGSPAVPAEDLLEWLRTVKGHGTKTARVRGTTTGFSRGRVSALDDERVPAGVRYEFTRDLVYRLRKQGLSMEDARESCREWWQRYDQPPVADTELPWRQVVYELERAWARVEPDPPLDESLVEWAQQQNKAVGAETTDEALAAWREGRR